MVTIEIKTGNDLQEYVDKKSEEYLRNKLSPELDKEGVTEDKIDKMVSDLLKK